MPIQQMFTQNIQEKPLMSFIITCFNTSADMLQACMKSIFDLEMESWEREVIIIDDGSEKPAINHMEEWKDQVIYLRQPNKGVSAARNCGMDMAHGRYIQFVDSDDLLLKESYERCLDLIRNMKPDILLFKMTHKEQDVEMKKGKVEGPIDGSIYMLHNNIGGGVCSYIFKSSLPINLRFTNGTAYAEDEEFTPQLLLRCKQLVATDIKAYYYREHSRSATQLKDEEHVDKRLEDNITVINRLHHLAEALHGTDREALRRRVNQLTMDFLYQIIHSRRNPKETEKAVKRLHAMGLFPLPPKNYTRKYQWFRLAMYTKAGRWLMSYLMP